MSPEGKVNSISGVDLNVSRTAWEWHIEKSSADIRNQVRRANRALEAVDIQAKFSIHEGTGEIIVKLEDTNTGEVIREIPPEKLLDLVAKMQEMARGMGSE
ncbi:MAG TPA: flagellar protein FlaG [Bacillota bacterium]|nr:flagellar protein FlaG [Bacillota bacterium]